MKAKVAGPPAERAASSGISTANLRSAFDRIGLPAWFVALDIVYAFALFDQRILVIDSRLYQQATHVWLAGGDPWALSAAGVNYAAGPWSLLAYLPTAWLPLEAATWTWAAVGFAAAVWTVRRLDMPLWWLAFPPVAHALWTGNAQPIVLGALLARAPWGVALAAGLKLYGLVPATLAGRWRELAIAAVVLAVSLPFLPWDLWVDHRFGFDAATGMTWNGSAWRFWPLIPVAVLALWLLRKRGAEWLTIPALWPGTQFFYHVFALPALVDKRLLAAALAVPLPLLAPVAVVAYAVLERRRQ